ncbi:MAG: hypothetical protein PARBA_02721 [Parabacteroides sp.]
MKSIIPQKVQDVLAFIHAVVRTLYYVLSRKKKSEKKL